MKQFESSACVWFSNNGFFVIRLAAGSLSPLREFRRRSTPAGSSRDDCQKSATKEHDFLPDEFQRGIEDGGMSREEFSPGRHS